MLQKIKIGTRLALAFAVLLLLISALAAGGIIGTNRLTERSAAMYGDRTVPLGVLAEISHLTQRNRVLVMDMLLDPGTSNMQASHAALTTNVERVNQLWTTYSGKALNPEEQGLAQDFADANASYLDRGLLPASSALVAGKYDDGSELYISQIRPSAEKVQDAIGQLVALQINVADTEFAGAREMSDAIHWWMLAATGLALVMGAVMAWVITCSISHPLRQAVVLARTVAGGDLTAQIDVRGTDETAELLGALREMNLQLVRVITEVRASSETVAQEAVLIAGGTEDLARRTEVQAANLQETAASMEQLTITVQHNTDNALRATELSKEAAEVANEGGRVMRDVIATMQEIRMQSQKIADIIKVIDDIAFQTNLLALNAAVEAARAGEHGRGFAVVAGEVRGLSQRSSTAAREIRDLIASSARGVERGSALVDHAGERVAITVMRVERVMEIISEIKDAGQEQASGIAQIGEAMRQLDAATQKNAAMVDDSSLASIGMKSQVRRLLEVIHQFRLTSDSAVGTMELPHGGERQPFALQVKGAFPKQLSMVAR
jgi:methyl-accepting chemotaxis protein